MNKRCVPLWTVLGLIVALAGCATSMRTPGPVSIVTDVPSPPEGLVHHKGMLYTSLAVSGQVLRIDPRNGNRTPYATFPSKPKATFLAGMVFSPSDELYAAVISFDPAIFSGVYKAPAGGGEAQRVAGPMAFPNGLAFDARGNLYASSSSDGRIYRVDPRGAMSVFSEAEPLKSHHPHGQFKIGVNGLAFDKSGNLWISNTDDGTILRMAITPQGLPGAITEVAKGLEGADGIEFNANDDLYIAVNRQNKVVMLAPDGRVHPVASGADIKYPSTVVPVDGKVYIANFNFEQRKPPFTIAVVPALR
jgi:sugar lactone lactonase YvrE